MIIGTSMRAFSIAALTSLLFGCALARDLSDSRRAPKIYETVLSPSLSNILRELETNQVPSFSSITTTPSSSENCPKFYGHEDYIQAMCRYPRSKLWLKHFGRWRLGDRSIEDKFNYLYPYYYFPESSRSRIAQALNAKITENWEASVNVDQDPNLSELLIEDDQFVIKANAKVTFSPITNPAETEFSATASKEVRISKELAKHEGHIYWLAALHVATQEAFVKAVKKVNANPEPFQIRLAPLREIQQPKPSGALSVINLDEAKNHCASLGFKAGTEKFGECVLKLSE